jgi:hypothetical protein
MFTLQLELVVSSIIEKLVLAPGPPIFWHFVGAKPTLEGDETGKRQLPLIVSLAEL